jgi:hypothetical protein
VLTRRLSLLATASAAGAASIGAYGCGNDDAEVTISERAVRVQAMGRFSTDECVPTGSGPTGSPWRCTVPGDPPLGGVYRVYITEEGSFRVVNPRNQEVVDACCVDVRASDQP